MAQRRARDRARERAGDAGGRGQGAGQVARQGRPQALSKVAKEYRETTEKHASLKRKAAATRASAIAMERERRKADDKERRAFFRRLDQYRKTEKKALDKKLKASHKLLQPVRAAEAKAEHAYMSASRAKRDASESLAELVGWERYVQPPCPWS